VIAWRERLALTEIASLDRRHLVVARWRRTSGRRGVHDREVGLILGVVDGASLRLVVADAVVGVAEGQVVVADAVLDQVVRDRGGRVQVERGGTVAEEASTSPTCIARRQSTRRLTLHRSRRVVRSDARIDDHLIKP
jgi:hypothetical protein